MRRFGEKRASVIKGRKNRVTPNKSFDDEVGKEFEFVVFPLLKPNMIISYHLALGSSVTLILVRGL